MFVHRHVMNELLETERAYVEELMCVLQVSEKTVSSFIYKKQLQSGNNYILLCRWTYSEINAMRYLYKMCCVL